MTSDTAAVPTKTTLRLSTVVKVERFAVLRAGR